MIKIVNVQEFIYNSDGSNNEHEIKDIKICKCSLCKKEIKRGIFTKKITSGNFTNHDSVSGNYLCEACANIMKSELSTSLRRSSFIAYKDRIEYFKQSDLRYIIFKEKELPFAMGVTFSYKKHNAFRCVLNYSNENYVIRQEEKLIEVNIYIAKELYKYMLYLYLTYFTKQDIKSGNYNIAFINKFGVEKFEKYESFLKNHRKTDLFDLLIEALPSSKKQEYFKKMKESEKTENKRSRKKSCNIDVFDME